MVQNIHHANQLDSSHVHYRRPHVQSNASRHLQAPHMTNEDQDRFKRPHRSRQHPDIASILHARRPFDALMLGSPFRAAGTREEARLQIRQNDIVKAEK